MEKLRPSNDSSKNARINLVKVAGEDLCHVHEELNPVAEEVDEEDQVEEGDEPEEGEVKGPERLQRDGEHEAEETVSTTSKALYYKKPCKCMPADADLTSQQVHHWTSPAISQNVMVIAIFAAVEV